MYFIFGASVGHPIPSHLVCSDFFESLGNQSYPEKTVFWGSRGCKTSGQEEQPAGRAISVLHAEGFDRNPRTESGVQGERGGGVGRKGWGNEGETLVDQIRVWWVKVGGGTGRVKLPGNTPETHPGGPTKKNPRPDISRGSDVGVL